VKVRTVLTIATAVALTVVGTLWIRSLVPPESPTGSLAFLSAAPELPIYDRAGKKTDLAREKGKILIVHFWATWCPPCVEEIPALSRFWQEYGRRDDLVLYSVSVDKDWKTIDAFTAKNPNDLPVYRDPDGKTATRFGTTQYPETYIANRAGRVLYRVPGAMSWDDPEVRRRIEQLLVS
jgi:cytochrome c biogenesis protein CcmG, thiol:disulfide interchange protein DsbE